jgi:hypothetical protein
MNQGGTMKTLISIVLLLLLSSPVPADQYEANAGEKADAAGGVMDTLPTTPQNFRMKISPQSLELIWGNPAEEQDQVTGYEISRANNYSGPYTIIATVEKGVKSYVDGAVSPEVVYYYKVRAVSGDRCSSYAGPVIGEIQLPGKEQGRRR